VKPIIGNKEIEAIQDPVYNAQYLTFQPWSAQEIVEKIESNAIEPHLSDVYSAMASNNTLNEKVNAILYFESIIVNSTVANRLINSAFMNLLARMMKSIKSPMIRVRLCSVVGLLIRHSTVIENDFAEGEVCKQIIEIMKDKNDKIKRKAIASLGEFLFYAATQLDDENADACWNIDEEAISTVIRALKPVEDSVVRLYACKTLENITAQSNSAGHKFATLETVKSLLQVFLDPESSDVFKTSAAVALSHIVRLNYHFFPVVFEQMGPERFCYVLYEGIGRV